MAWKIIKREDTFQRNAPFISISSAYVAFNAMFTRVAKIGREKRVTIYVDPENFRLGFEFHSNKRPYSFALSKANRAKNDPRPGGFFCRAGFLSDYPWIRSITERPLKARRFYNPKKEGSKWVIQFGPRSENKKEFANLPISHRKKSEFIDPFENRET
jgi:hypothetical protein